MLTYFLITIAAIPILNSTFLAFCKKEALSNFVNKLSPILFATTLFGIYQRLNSEGFYLVLVKIFSAVSLSILLDFEIFNSLALLNFLWLVFVFYSSRFFELIEFKETKNFRLFFALNIFGLTFLIISKNLFSALFAYYFIILFSLIFALNFLYKKEDKFLPFYNFIFYLKLLLILLAALFTHKFITKLEFIGVAPVLEMGFLAQIIMILLYFLAFFLVLIAPFYALRQRNLAIIYAFFVPFAFAGFFILSRILNFIFGFKNFSNLLEKTGFVAIELLFSAFLVIFSILMIFSKSLKSSIFYLFFQRFIFALFLFILFAKFNVAQIHLPLYSLMLEFTLIFFTTSNLHIYFTKSQQGNFIGLFYKMPLTCLFLTFAFTSMMGIAPTISALEKFFAIGVILQNKLWISLFFVAFSSLSLAIFFIKSLRFIFLKNSEEFSIEDTNLAKDIDFDSSLILTGLLVSISLFALFVINFFHHL